MFLFFEMKFFTLYVDLFCLRCSEKKNSIFLTSGFSLLVWPRSANGHISIYHHSIFWLKIAHFNADSLLFKMSSHAIDLKGSRPEIHRFVKLLFCTFNHSFSRISMDRSNKNSTKNFSKDILKRVFNYESTFVC